MRRHLLLAAVVLSLSSLSVLAETKTEPAATSANSQVMSSKASEAQQQVAADYPYLSNWDVPYKDHYIPNLNETRRQIRCPLKPEEAKWLEEQIAVGALRIATQADIDAWEELANKKRRRIQKIELDCGRTYTILKQMVIPPSLTSDPNVRMSGDIVFLVEATAPFPKVLRSGSSFYDLHTGGWFMLGQYDDGTKEGVAKDYPRYNPNLYSNGK